jgi:hypothetical protein
MPCPHGPFYFAALLATLRIIMLTAAVAVTVAIVEK